jgi:hypothetical protein
MAESGSGYASSASSSVLAFLKIGRVEAFGELAINRREDVTGFRAALLTAKRPRCAQTPNVRDERRNARWYRAVMRYPRRSARATLISANPERPEMMGESIAQPSIGRPLISVSGAPYIGCAGMMALDRASATQAGSPS